MLAFFSLTVYLYLYIFFLGVASMDLKFCLFTQILFPHTPFLLIFILPSLKGRWVYGIQTQKD